MKRHSDGEAREQLTQLSLIPIATKHKPRIEGLSECGLDPVEEGHCVRDTVE